MTIALILIIILIILNLVFLVILALDVKTRVQCTSRVGDFQIKAPEGYSLYRWRHDVGILGMDDRWEFLFVRTDDLH